MHHISPSMLCADQMNLGAQADELNGLGIDWFHLDVMDGSFVPNFALGTDSIRSLNQVARHPLYVHLMAQTPEKHVASFKSAGADYFCFHIETTANPFRLCGFIREQGMKPAAAFNPSTPLDILKNLAPYLDAITLMSVEPGYSGQPFLPFMYRRIARAKELIGDYPVLIEVDGGVDNDIAVRCIEAGCDVVVGGYFTLFLKGKSISENYKSFEAAIGGVAK